MRKYSIPFLILIVIIFSLFYMPLLKQWLFSFIALADKHEGFIAFIGVVLALITLLPLAQQIWGKRHPKPLLDPNRTILEHNYLHQLEDLFKELQRNPLMPDSEGEILELRAELIIEPKFKISEATPQHENNLDKGKFTSNLVKTLLKAKTPVVVLGEPGAGKSVSLQKAMLSLAKQGTTQALPLLPIYLRLGTFTQQIVDKNNDVIKFARESLKNLGGHAERLEKNFDKYLHEGRIVFLLDAMDEMPRDHIKERFDALQELRRFAGNKILFACRKLDFPETFPFLRANIQPFNRGQIKLFLRKTLGDKLGKIASNEILSPLNPLREMAGNPFFLKLLSLFYKEHTRLPVSRTELMKIYEDQVFARAQSRAIFPPALDLVAFRAILARLAYMITTSGRGVTILINAFTTEFMTSLKTEGEGKLDLFRNRIEDVLHVAINERLLRIEKKCVDNVYSEILSFYHHRLQEYYTAAYLEEFKPQFIWESRFDDIWWQEILIMLFGITERPNDYMEILLRNIPAELIVCSNLGPALSDIVANVGEYNKENELEEAIKKFLSLDSSGFYGFKKITKGAIDAETFSKRLAKIGVLESDSDLWKFNSSDLKTLSPEPDDNKYTDCVRQWLENRNAIILDWIELGVECYRNALHKISQITVDRFATLLAVFSRNGNMGEAVRAIQISTRLSGTDWFPIVEPALIHKDAWCRREAMAAIAKHSTETDAYRGDTGFIVFLQFAKGELLLSLPQFFRALLELPRLAWFLPGTLLLGAISVMLLLSPGFIIYKVLSIRYPFDILGLEGVLKNEWPTVVFVISCFLSLLIYLLKLRWGVSIIRTTLFICVIFFFLPEIIEPIAKLREMILSAGINKLFIEEKNTYSLNFASNLGRVSLVVLGITFSPQIIEIITLSIMALIFCILLRSSRILKIRNLYLSEINLPVDYFEKVQFMMAVLAFYSLILTGLLFLYAKNLLLFKIIIMAPILIFAIWGLVALISWMWKNLRKGYRPKEFLKNFYQRIKIIEWKSIEWDDFFETTWMITKGIGAIVALIGLGMLLRYIGVFALIGRIIDLLFDLLLKYLGPIITIALILLIVFIFFDSLRLLLINLVDFIRLYYNRFSRLKKAENAPGFKPKAIATKSRDIEIFREVDKVIRQENMSSTQRFNILRESLRRIKSSWMRSSIYREMAKTRREIRQENLNKNSE